MKITVALLLLAAASHAAQTASSKHQNNEANEKTEKRELVEGNSSLEKRAPLFSTVSPAVTTGGIEYADSKEGPSEKSPTQQIYATPAPEVPKISDVLSSQGHQFQAAIANHLYSPISIYQPRLGSPTTYEVSAPVPSQLAYAEHRLSVPSPNSIQFGNKIQKLTKPVNYEQPQFIQPSYNQNLNPIQPLFQQVSNNVQNIPQPVQYSQQAFGGQQQIQYVQHHPSQIQSGISYSQEQSVQTGKQPEQRDIRSKSVHSQILEKQPIIQQDYNNKDQGAQSYASFTFNQSPTFDQSQQQKISPPQTQVQIPQQNQQQYQQQQQQYQPLAQINYHLQHPSLVQQQYQPQQLSQPQLHIQPQIQAPPAPQLLQHTVPQPQIQYQSQNPQIQYQPQQPLTSLQYQAYQAQQQQQQQQEQQLSAPQPQIQSQQPLQYQVQQPQQIQYQAPQQIPYQIEQQPQFLFQPPQLLNQQFQIQPQQYEIPQIQPQLFAVEKSESKDISAKQEVKQLPIYQPQYTQNQASNHDVNKGIPALPTFPPVQYFGKFAHSIFEH